MVTATQERTLNEKRKLSIKLPRKFIFGAILPVLLLIVWELAGRAGALNPLLLPKPTDIYNEFIYLWQKQDLIGHIVVSTQRAIIGFLIGGSLGLCLGVVVGFFNKVERIFNPSIQLIRMLPYLAIAPLFILWFGFGETSKLLLIAKGSFFPMYVNTFLGIRSIDQKLFEVANIYQYSKKSLMTKLIIPSALPNIFLGIRLSVGVAWLGLVVAEMMGSTEGIGFLVNDARAMSLISTVFVGIILFAILGKLSDAIVLKIQSRVLRWQNSFKGR